MCWTSYGRNGVLLIGRGVAYRKTDETDLLRSKRGSCSSGGVWRTAKWDSTGYCSSPPSTSSSLHLRLFIHGLLFIQPPPRATPLTTVQPPLSMGSCSTTPPRATVDPALHRLLFILPSTGWSCSSCPPRGHVHPAPTGSINRGPVHPEATPRGPVHPPPPGAVHPTPLQLSLFIQRQH